MPRNLIFENSGIFSYNISRLNNVVLQCAVPATGRKITALGVEQCKCPQEYSGLSCQVPTGFSSAIYVRENNIYKNTFGY